MSWQSKPPIGTGIDWSNPLSQGLVGCWLFNEGGGSQAFDVAQNLVGNLSGSIAYPPAGATLGSSSYLSIGYNQRLHIGPLSTIFMVGSVSSLSTPQSVFASDVDGTNYRGVIVTIATSGYIDVLMGAGGEPGPDARRSTTATSRPLEVGKQFSMACVQNSFTAAASLYNDGLPCTANASGNGASFVAGTSPSSIGRHYVGSYVYSSATSRKVMLIYNRALSANEIQQLHENPYQICQSNPSSVYLPRSLDPTKNIFRWY